MRNIFLYSKWLFVANLMFTAFLLASFSACQSATDYDKDVLLITGTEVSPVVKFVIGETEASYTVTVSATKKLTSDATIHFEYDKSLVDSYNATYGTSYYAIPEEALSIDTYDVTIEAGTAFSTGVTVSANPDEGFVTGRTYLIPLTIANVKGSELPILDASKTIYLRTARSFDFYSLDMMNTNLYSNFIFDDNKAVAMSRYTYEIKCYINEFHSTPEQISRLCSFTSKNESGSNMLRFGENGQDINSLQWVHPDGNMVSATRFSEKKWYLLSLVCDGNGYALYVDGVKDVETSTSTTPVTFQRLELGMSWTNYNTKQYFNGRVAEIRVWNRALTSNELQIGACGVDPDSEGLVAYWKMNEGEGHIFYDLTGNGYNMDWSNVYREENDGAGLVNRDKSAYVNWIIDENNICNQ